MAAFSNVKMARAGLLTDAGASSCDEVESLGWGPGSKVFRDAMA